jgi:hypothetical protein
MSCAATWLIGFLKTTAFKAYSYSQVSAKFQIRNPRKIEIGRGQTRRNSEYPDGEGRMSGQVCSTAKRIPGL